MRSAMHIIQDRQIWIDLNLLIHRQKVMSMSYLSGADRTFWPVGSVTHLVTLCWNDDALCMIIVAERASLIDSSKIYVEMFNEIFYKNKI